MRYKIKKNEIINIKTTLSEDYSRYLVVKINKKQKYIDLLPIDRMVEESVSIDTVPVMSMPFNLISKIKRDKDISLLFLANHNNPHIVNAIMTSG